MKTAKVASLKPAAQTCVECGKVAETFGDGLCRNCWIAVVVEYGGNPTAAFLPGPPAGGKEDG